MGEIKIITKYPRTRHIVGSNIQKGDENLKIVSVKEIENKFLVIEEKIDGANCGISFDNTGKMFLQSRGHFLTGGYRERHFALFKTWTGVYKDRLYELLSDKYIMYGEWMYAKHTVFYDLLPHYFMEFDIFDKEKKIFLSTKKRKELLKNFSFIHSVPVLYEGKIKSFEELKTFIKDSLYKSKNCKENLIKLCEEKNLNAELVLKQTNLSNLSEGIYIKQESENTTDDRFKLVRKDFTNAILESETHWIDRPIIENLLESGEIEWS